MSKAYEELTNRLGEIVDLFGAASVLGWDHRTQMPRNGAVARSEQLGTLTKLMHTMFVSPEFGKLLDEAAPWAEEQGYDSLEASLVRVVRRDYDKLVRVPPELVRGDVPHSRDRRARLARGARGVRLVDVPAVPGEGDRAPTAVRGLLRACRRGLRHPPRRLRARHEDGRSAGGLRRAEGGPRAAHRRGRRARTTPSTTRS